MKTGERVKRKEWSEYADHWYDPLGIISFIEGKKRYTTITVYGTFDIYVKIPTPPGWQIFTTKEAKISEETIDGWWNKDKEEYVQTPNLIRGDTRNPDTKAEEEARENETFEKIASEYFEKKWQQSPAAQKLKSKSGKSVTAEEMANSDAQLASELIDQFSLMVYAADFDPSDEDNSILMFPRSSRINGVINIPQDKMTKIQPLVIGQTYSKQDLMDSVSALNDLDSAFKALPDNTRFKLSSIQIDDTNQDPGRIKLGNSWKYTVILKKRTYAIVVTPEIVNFE